MRRLLPLTLAVLLPLFCASQAQETEQLPTIGHYAMEFEPLSLDPQHAYDAGSLSVIGALYDTLLEYHPTKTDPHSLRPCILQSLPAKEVSAAGGHSYVCEIRRGVRFHDDPCFPGGKGREVTANDIHYAFQRICDPAVESPFYDALAEVVVGMSEARAEAAKEQGKYDYNRSKVAGIEVLDARRFRIQLRKPWPQIFYWLAAPCTAPMAREAVERYGIGGLKPLRQSGVEGQAVGTGPFRLSHFELKQQIQLKRVAGYATTVFPEDAGASEPLKSLGKKPLPLLDEVELLVSRDHNTLLDAFRRGALDAMPLNKETREAVLDGTDQPIPKLRERGVQLHWQAEASTFYLAFNLDDAVVGKNKELRQAISRAFDARAFAARFKTGIPAAQLLPPGIFGHDPERKNPQSFDLEKAKDLLAKGGYAGGRKPDGEPLEITILTAANPLADEHAEFYRSAIETLGLKVKVERLRFAEVFARKEEGKFQIFAGGGWGADYPDAENFFMLFRSASIPPRGQNFPRYRNAEFDRIFEKMSSMEDSPPRAALIRQLNDLLGEDCPIIFTTHKRNGFVSQPWAPITQRNPFLYGGFRYLTVDPKLRARLLKEWETKER